MKNLLLASCAILALSGGAAWAQSSSTNTSTSGTTATGGAGTATQPGGNATNTNSGNTKNSNNSANGNSLTQLTLDQLDDQTNSGAAATKGSTAVQANDNTLFSTAQYQHRAAQTNTTSICQHTATSSKDRTTPGAAARPPLTHSTGGQTDSPSANQRHQDHLALTAATRRRPDNTSTQEQ